MELKLDENGFAVVQDGKPVYVGEDGKEILFDAAQTIATIRRINGEAKSHREAKEALEAKLRAFEGIEDPEAARKALETLRNIDEGKLIAAGKVEEIKAAAAKAAQDQVAAQAKAHAEAMAKLKSDYDSLQHEYHDQTIRAAFSGSKFLAEKAAVPADIIQARFGSAFKVEGGKLVAYDSNGNQIYSNANPGEPASFDEALEMIISRYEFSDQILKDGRGSGGGARQGGAGSGGAKTLTRDEYEKMPPLEQTAKIREGWRIVSA